MTQNQLTYWANQETARSNLARETETHRHNVEDETETHRANVADETERNRSNRTREDETHRSNVRNEQIKQDNLDLDAWNALWGKNGVYSGNWKQALQSFGLKQTDYKGRPILNDTYFGDVQGSPSYTVPKTVVGGGLQNFSDTLWSGIDKVLNTKIGPIKLPEYKSKQKKETKSQARKNYELDPLHFPYAPK